MTSSPDNTVDKILDDIIHIGYVNGYNQLAQMAQVAPYNHVQPISVDQAKQSLDSYYLSIFLELVGEDDKLMVVPEPIRGIDQLWLEGRANGEFTAKNALKAELRTALQDRLGEKS